MSGGGAGPAARTASIILTGLLTGVLMAGCGDPRVSPEEGAANVEQSKAAVDDAMRSIAEVAAGAGLTLGRLVGGWTVCGVEPPSMKYDAGGGVERPAPVAETIATLTEALARDGWTVEDAGTEPRPYGVLVRDDLRASLGESRRYPGRVSVGVIGPCVDTTKEQESLLGEEHDIG